jgi:uncharacterized protein YbjT (DUF2867 family)
MSDTVLVTGATGKTGRRLLPLLAGRGADIRAATRNPDTAFQDAVTVRFDWRDPDTYALALDGVDAVYMVTSHYSDNTSDPSAQVAQFVEVAAKAGVERIVHLSAFGIDKAPESEPLRRTERLVEDSGIAFTTLRPSAFMENFSESHWAHYARRVRDHDELAMPNSQVRMTFVSVRDVAAVAFYALIQEGHTGKGYTLTGPEALSWADIAGHISATVGRQVTYREVDADWIRQMLLADGATDAFAEGVAELTASSTGENFMATVSGDVEAVTGRRPIPFTEFARTAAAAWQ